MPPVNRDNPVRAASSESEYTVMDFMREFPDDATCLEHLWRTRFAPNGEDAHCQKCQAVRTFKRYETAQQRQSWTCTACGHHLHVLAGTIFEKSSTSLHLWFYAMYLMTSTRCGISAKQLERELGVTYKTAWRIAHLIRHKLMTQDTEPLDSGNPVEIDETYVGGRRRGTRRGRPGPESHKVPVLGIVQSAGKVAAMTVPNVQRATVYPQITKRVLPASTVYTDELRVYDTLDNEGYQHKCVNHSENVWVSGDVHTNTIEVLGTHEARYLGCLSFGFRQAPSGLLERVRVALNERLNPRAKFSTLLRRATT